MVIGPKRTLFMDEISTGLDASTTQQIVQCISNLVHFRDVSPAAPFSMNILYMHQLPNFKGPGAASKWLVVVHEIL